MNALKPIEYLKCFDGTIGQFSNTISYLIDNSFDKVAFSSLSVIQIMTLNL